MLVNTKTYQMLRGVRSQEGVDIDAIAEALQRLSQLVTEFPEIQEMDIKPVSWWDRPEPRRSPSTRELAWKSTNAV